MLVMLSDQEIYEQGMSELEDLGFNFFKIKYQSCKTLVTQKINLVTQNTTCGLLPMKVNPFVLTT